LIGLTVALEPPIDMQTPYYSLKVPSIRLGSHFQLIPIENFSIFYPSQDVSHFPYPLLAAQSTTLFAAGALLNTDSFAARVLAEGDISMSQEMQISVYTYHWLLTSIVGWGAAITAAAKRVTKEMINRTMVIIVVRGKLMWIVTKMLSEF
jgi:hypothetical protein